MLRCGKILGLFVLIVTLATPAGQAFSLLGPYQPWMQTTNGFQQPGDIGGPMNLGEEYRWNVPVLTYAFDQSFLDYFGSNGVWAVEQAIQILNDLPPASQLDPASYPTEATQINYVGQALNLTDLKSKTLAVLIEQLGLAQPTRHTFCAYSFGFHPGGLYGQNVKRNFDPFNFAPTNWVNDTAYDHFNQLTTNGPTISLNAEEFPIDPFDNIHTAVADGVLAAGQFYTGLTRDDVGGLRYLLHTNNFNPEILLSNVHGIGPNAGAYANYAQRRGVDKITWVRRDYDFFTGQFFTPYTNQFTDRFIAWTHFTNLTQQLERVVTVPDILFSMTADGVASGNPFQILRTGTTNWWKIPFVPGPAATGLIRPPIKLSLPPSATYVTTSDLWSDAAVDYLDLYWATYDISTNAPIIYPLANHGSDVVLNLKLARNNAVIERRSWQIPTWPSASVTVQTSTNLVNWTPYLVLEAGKQVEWTHHCALNRRFFRIVPNN